MPSQNINMRPPVLKAPIRGMAEFSVWNGNPGLSLLYENHSHRSFRTSIEGVRFEMLSNETVPI